MIPRVKLNKKKNMKQHFLVRVFGEINFVNSWDVKKKVGEIIFTDILSLILANILIPLRTNSLYFYTGRNIPSVPPIFLLFK